MLNFTINNDNKSIYLIKPNTQWFYPLKFYTKCHKLNYFSPNKNIAEINICNIDYIVEIITRTNFNIIFS